MVYLPQTIQSLGHQLETESLIETEETDYAVWDQLMPKPTTMASPTPLTPEAIFRLAERTIREAPDKPIIVADELTALLPPELTAQFIDLLKGQAAAGKTVLVTSSQYQVVSQADQVITLENNNT